MHSFYLKKAYAFTLLILFSNYSGAQSLLLDPLQDGGFESGTTLSANGWQTANAATNRWFAGNGATPQSGIRCAYIDNGTGATNNYTITTAQTSHIYRDITFPANEPRIILSFKWKGGGEANKDYLTVFGVNTTVTPLANTPSGTGANPANVTSSYSGAVLLSTPAYFSEQSSAWQTHVVILPASYAGTTKRIVFMWSNNSTAGTQPAMAIDSVSLISAPYGNSITTGLRGAWNEQSTWLNGLLPTAGDTAIIKAGSMVALTKPEAMAKVMIEGGAVLKSAYPLTVTNNVEIAQGGTLSLHNNNVAGALLIGGHLFDSGTIDMDLPGCVLNFNGTSAQAALGNGVFVNRMIPKLFCSNPFLVQFTLDVIVSTELNLKGDLIGSGEVTLGNPGQSKVFNFISTGGKIALNKNTINGFNNQVSVNYTYNASFPSSSYSTGNELNIVSDSLNVTISNFGTSYLKLGTHATVKNLTLLDTLDVDTNQLTINGQLNFLQSFSIIKGAGRFYTGNRANLIICSPGGIASTGLSGAIQTGTRFFNPQADYYFKTGALLTGTGLPDTLYGTVTIFAPTLLLSKPTVFNHLYLMSTFEAQVNSVRVNGTGTFNSYYINGTSTFTSGPASKLILRHNLPQGILVANGSAGNIRTTGGITIMPGTSIVLSNGASVLGNGFPLTGIDSLFIGDVDVRITQPLAVNTLVMMGSGKTYTSALNTFSVNKKIIRAGTGFIVGPLTRVVDSTFNGPLDFPISFNSEYKSGVQFLNPVIKSGTVSVTMFVSERNSTGMPGSGLSALNPSLLWAFKVNGTGSFISGGNVRLECNSLTKVGRFNKVGFYKGNSSAGIYNSLGGSLDSANVTVTSGSPLDSVFMQPTDSNYMVLAQGEKAGTFAGGIYAVGESGDFKNLTTALAQLSEYTKFGGTITLELQPDYSPLTELYPIVFTGSIPSSRLANLVIRPAATISSPIQFSGAVKGLPLFDFNWNSHFITIDGRPGGAGSGRMIMINQLDTAIAGSPAIRLINKAQYNSLINLVISALNPSTGSGVLTFSTSTVPGFDNGNSYNTVDNCIIDGRANASSYIQYGVSSATGIYSAGSEDAENRANVITRNDIVDCYSGAAGGWSKGIFLGLFNKNWTIGTTGAGNRIYHTSQRTSTSLPPISASGIPFYGIHIEPGVKQDTLRVEGNHIGGNIAGIPGAVIHISDNNANASGNLSGIFIALPYQYESALVSVKENTIAGITACFGTSSQFTGIYVSGKNIPIANNTIRDISCIHKSPNSLDIGISLVGGNAIIKDNFIGNINGVLNNEVVSNGTLWGIHTSSASETDITGNTIENLEVFPGTQARASIIGMIVGSQEFTRCNVSGNILSGFVNNYSGTGEGNITGIQLLTTGGANAVLLSRNVIKNFRSYSGYAGTNEYPMLNGIWIGATDDAVVAEYNEISNLQNHADDGTVTINGIVNLSKGPVLLNANKVNALLQGALNARAVINGINLRGTSLTPCMLTNNVICLGLDSSGNSIIQPVEINGVRKSGGLLRMAHNTIYIGGSNVTSSGSLASSALKISGTLLNDTIENTVFFNARSNVSTGGGNHYALQINSPLKRWANNVYHANGTGGLLALYMGAAVADIKQWQSLLLSDTASIGLNPRLANPASGSASINLSLSSSMPSPAEANGVFLTDVLTDVSGNLRANYTPVDIGAYSGNFIKADVAGPVISFNPVTNTHLKGNRALDALITDVTGVPVSGPNVPRLHYKKMNSGIYVSVAGVLVSGNGRNGSWSFTIDTSLVGGLLAGDSIYYFFAAQDTSAYANLSLLPPFGAGLSVNNVISAPKNVYSFKVADEVSGNFRIGASQVAPDFTTISQAVNYLNNKLVTGNINLLLQADYNSAQEPAFPIVLSKLNMVNDSFVVTIKPDVGVNKIISGNSSTAVIKINGGSNYIIDGSNNGTDSRNLEIANTALFGNTACVWLCNLNTTEASFNTIKNTILYSGIDQQGSSGISFGIISSAFINESPGSTLPVNRNNRFINNYIYKVTVGVQLNNEKEAVVSGNLIGAAQPGPNIIGKSGMQLFFGENMLIERNEIRSVMNLNTYPVSRTACAGIFIVGCKNSTISQNRVHDIISEKNKDAFGIYVRPQQPINVVSNNLVANNIVYKVRSNAFATGISISGGINERILFNTVYLTDSMDKASIPVATGTASAFTLFQSMGAEIRNNIFSNAAASRTSSQSHTAVSVTSNTSWGSSVFDHNSFFVSPENPQLKLTYIDSVFYDLAGIKQVTGQNDHSISTEPFLNSGINLVPDLRSPVLSGGVAISGMQLDINNALRNIPPAIGAFEIPHDSSAPRIVFVPLNHAASTGNRVVRAVITDHTGIPFAGATRPRIYFKKMTGGSWFSNPGSFVSGNPLESTWDFTIDAALMGGLSVNDSVYYYLIAQDSSVAANTGTKPAGGIAVNVNSITSPPVPFSYKIFNGASGNYLVGASQLAPNFTTITAALGFLSGKLVAGNINLLIQSDYNALMEPSFPIVFNPYLSGADPGVYKVTLKPDTGVNDTIYGSSSTSVLSIAGGDWYVIDGSNNGTSSRNLTIINTTAVTSGTPSVVSVSSLGIGKGACNNAIKNLNIRCNYDQRNNNPVSRGVVIAGQNSDSNEVSNNYITRVTNGIVATSVNLYNNTGNRLVNNLIGPVNFGADQIGKSGIVLNYEQNGFVLGNEIRSVGAISGDGSAANDKYGIQAGGDGIWPGTLNSTSVRRMTIARNNIHNIVNEKGQSAFGICVASSSSTSANLVENNEIYNVRANSAGSFEVSAGILFVKSSSDSFLYNTINLSGDVDPAGASNATSPSYGVYIASEVKNPVFRNNLVNIDLTSNSNVAHGAIYIPEPYSFGTGSSDYNAWYNRQPVFARQGTTGIFQYANWVNVTGQDSNSVFKNPLLNSFHKTIPQHNSPVWRAGIFLQGHTVDIIDSVRKNPPAIGAYQYPQDYTGPAISYAPLKNTTALTNRISTGFAYISDTSQVDVSVGNKPRIYFRKKSDQNVFAANNASANGWKWTEATNAASPFSFEFNYSLLQAPVSLGDTIVYFVVAQDLTNARYTSAFPSEGFSGNSVSSINTAPSVPDQYLLTDSALHGNYYVGSAQTAPHYKTLTHAIADLNLRGVSAPVIFTLLDSVYSTAETFPLRVKLYEGASETNTVVLRPGLATRPEIRSAVFEGAFALDGCRYFKIDGRQNGTDSSNSLTISNTTNSGDCTIGFKNGASRNQLVHTTILGQESSFINTISAAVILFNEAGEFKGNDSNVIANCTIGSSSSSVYPRFGILAERGNYAPNARNRFNTIDSCNIFNFHSQGGVSAGISLYPGNSGWKITNNRFYQTFSRHYTGGYSIAAIAADISLDTDTLLITGNKIGGKNAAGTGVYEMTGTHFMFKGIDVKGGANTYTSIQGNVISGLSMSGSVTTGAALVGINTTGGYVNIGGEQGNTIGSLSSNGSVSFVAGVSGGGFTGIQMQDGIDPIIKNNRIGGINLDVTSPAFTNRFTGISYASDSNGVISNNLIGSETIANSINIAGTSSTSNYSYRMSGINVNCYNCLVFIDSNTIANINNNSVAVQYFSDAPCDLSGISIAGGSGVIRRNKILRLSSSEQNRNVINGIFYDASAVISRYPAIIQDNHIYGLTYKRIDNGPGPATVKGINFKGSKLTNGNSVITRNNIHSFSVIQGAFADLTAIDANSQGPLSITNNMIRLGIDEAGNSINASCYLSGIIKRGGTANILNNSVYIGGIIPATYTGRSVAFSRTDEQYGYDTVVNNIFVNNRSNTTTGEKHYCLDISYAKRLFINRNIYQYTGNGGVFATFNDTPAYKKGWRVSDNESQVTDPQFINPDGNLSTVDLHLKASMPVPGERAGMNLTDPEVDFDGQLRSLQTPSDIGADAGNYTAQDVFPPLITFEPLKNDTVAGLRVVDAISITDATGVNVMPNRKPRLYFKRRTDHDVFLANVSSSNGWKFVEASNSSSPFSFVIDYNLLQWGQVFEDDTIDYFIVAQDTSPNANTAASSSLGFAGTSISAITKAPVPLFYRISKQAMSGTYLVGVGQPSPGFHTLTAALYDLHTRGVKGPVMFSLTDTLYNTFETFPLVIKKVQGSSPVNTITIKPSLPLTRITSKTAPLIFHLNDASYVKIDGSVDASGSKNLTIQNAQNGSAMLFTSEVAGCTNDTLTNTILLNAYPNSNFDAGIAVCGATAADDGFEHKNLAFINNSILQSGSGIRLSSLTFIPGLVIRNNLISGSAFNYNQTMADGIYIKNADAPAISGNTISDIFCGNGHTSAITLENTLNATISSNKIYGIDAGSNPNRSHGIRIKGASNNYTSIVNNFISEVNSQNIAIGVSVEGGKFFSILHNTIWHTNQRGFYYSPPVSYNLSIGGDAGRIAFENNQLINTLSPGSSATQNYLIYSTIEYPFSTINYNNYYTRNDEENARYFMAYTPFMEMKTYAIFKQFIAGENSKNVPVNLVSSTDLHLAGSSIGDVNLRAKPHPLVPTDIDGDLRNTVFTYMGADENTGTPVPVKLLQFTAARQGADVELNWSTASENNNYGFDVERSVDGKRFEKAGFVKGTPGSAIKSRYTWLDEKAFKNEGSNALYYRLKQLDIDGRFTYSSTALVTNPVNAAMALTAYPNPFSNSLKVRFITEEGEATIQLRDLNGKLVYSANAQLNAGENELAMDNLSELNSGMYFMSIITPVKTSVIKVIKQ